MNRSTILSPAAQTQHELLLDGPERVTLGVRPGAVASGKPPVRIFLGTEDEQYRAERIFFYSIEQVRDPGRIYEIYRMNNLAGYARRGSRTAFTNYRFAVPDYAGRQGKAIYNDADQIYMADPGQLYDLDLDGHGYRAVSANDTSVMLLDCARMANWWNLEAATSETKATLHSKVVNEPGLWAPLEGGWNARDMEFVPGRSMLLHYTAMHTQPWHPFPKEYSYHDHPLGEVWHRLERAADAEGYQVFTRAQPSPMFGTLLEMYRRGNKMPAAPTPPAIDMTRLLSEYQIKSVLQVGLCLGERAAMDKSLSHRQLDLALPGATWPVDPSDAVLAIQLLERTPGEDVPWLIDQLFRAANRLVYIAVQCLESGTAPADDNQQYRCLRDVSWWRDQITRTALRYPNVDWRLDAVHRNRQRSTSTVACQSGLTSASAAPPPKVWVLAGNSAGERAQLLSLAEALGWPFEIKDLTYNGLRRLSNLLLAGTTAVLDRGRSTELAQPWPDIVLDSGRHSVPIARWIRDQSGGRARWIHLGRPWGTPIELIDLLISTPQYRLFPRPNILLNAATLHRVTPQKLTLATASPAPWSALPRPWIGLLVGGDSSSYVLDAATAGRLGAEASAAAKEAGGSLLVTTSGRTQPSAVDALFGAITAPAHLYRWQAGAAENPYIAILAQADSLIVTGDSASMLAEACSTGKPVAMFDLPRHRKVYERLLAVLKRVIGGNRARTNYRGMPKQQDAMARMFDRLIEVGWYRPRRDLGAYHQALIDRGLMFRLGDPLPATPRQPLDDMQRAVDRIRRLMSAGRRVD